MNIARENSAVRYCLAILLGIAAPFLLAIHVGAQTNKAVRAGKYSTISKNAVTAKTTVSSTATSIRVRCAGTSYTDSKGNAWVADTGYFNTGNPSNSASQSNVSGTTDPMLFRNARWGPTPPPEMTYSFPLANGTYTVNLYFAETYSGTQHIGARVFDVNIQGTTAVSRLDIFARAGANAALVISNTASVTNGTLQIGFVHHVENPIISAIEVVQTGQAGPASVTVGVSPTNATVVVNGTQTLTALVQNDSNNKGVSWNLTGSGCTGSACGTLANVTATGVTYTAPASVPSPASVSVIATSIADGTKSATANITISPAIAIAVSNSPSQVTVSVNSAQNFSATVLNDATNTGVSWYLSGSGCSGTACGTLSNMTKTSVTYTAPAALPNPATVSLTATSVADSSKAASSVITISQGIPTTLGWYQIPNTMLQPICPQIPQIQGTIGCQGLISAWNGGIADTKRNRLLIWGGGHQNYWGNEVYALNLNDQTLKRITDPTVPIVGGCVEQWSTNPPAPAARETYAGLTYITNLDKFWVLGGALATSGCQSSGMWTLDLTTLNWTRQDPTNGTQLSQLTPYTDINYSDFDAATNKVFFYVANAEIFGSYTPATNTVTPLLVEGSWGVPGYSNGVIDPIHRQFIVLGAGFAGSFNLDTGAFTNFSSQTTNCSGIQKPNYPGLAWDSVQNKIVGWAGGNSVYLFDFATKSCSTVTYTGGPPAQQPNGTYGRWRYFPSLNLFALINDWKQNAYTLRLTPAP